MMGDPKRNLIKTLANSDKRNRRRMRSTRPSRTPFRRPIRFQWSTDDQRACLSFLTLLIRMARIILERHTDYPIWQQMGKCTYFITVIPGGSKSALPLCQLNVRIPPESGRVAAIGGCIT